MNHLQFNTRASDNTENSKDMELDIPDCLTLQIDRPGNFYEDNSNLPFLIELPVIHSVDSDLEEISVTEMLQLLETASVNLSDDLIGENMLSDKNTAPEHGKDIIISTSNSNNNSETYSSPILIGTSKVSSVSEQCDTLPSVKTNVSCDQMKPVDAKLISKHLANLLASKDSDLYKLLQQHSEKRKNKQSDTTVSDLIALELSATVPNIKNTKVVAKISVDRKTFQPVTQVVITTVHNEDRFFMRNIEEKSSEYDEAGSSEKKDILQGDEMDESGSVPSIVLVNGKKVILCPNRCKKNQAVQNHGAKPYKCTEKGCPWAFCSTQKLKRHMETHLNKKDFKCSVEGCMKMFTTIYNLKSHLRLHDRPHMMKCPVEDCGSSYQTKRMLDMHIYKMHQEVELPYKCDQCDQKFMSKNCLFLHNRSHKYTASDVECQWDGCGKKFTRPSRLKAHMLLHTGQKPFTCTFQGCEWSFTSVSRLRRHERRHTNDRRFTCSVEECGKSFLRPEHLKSHINMHTRIKTCSKCSLCGDSFLTKAGLTMHMKSHADGSGKLVLHCPISECSRLYASKRALGQHMLKIHQSIITEVSPKTNKQGFLSLLPSKDVPDMTEDIHLTTEDSMLIAVANASQYGVQFCGDSSLHNTSQNVSHGDILVNTTQMTSYGDNILQVATLNITGDKSTMHFLEDSSLPLDSANNVIAYSTHPQHVGEAGSARTNFAYQDYLEYKIHKKQSSSKGFRRYPSPWLGTGRVSCLGISSDMVLSPEKKSTDSGISEDLCIPSELQTSDLLPLETTQLLLTSNDYPQSTINLRDLE